MKQAGLKEIIQRLIFDLKAFWTQRKIIQAISIVLVVLAIGWHFTNKRATSADNESPVQSKLGPPVEVLYNYDGDTLTVHIPNHKPHKERVRLIGIDTPEKGQGEWGRKATLYTRMALKHHKVFLTPGTQTRDKYNRLLAYVWIKKDDGKLAMLNELLLREGLAVLLTMPPNTAYTEIFKEAYKYARQNKKGFWGDGGLRVSPSEYRRK
jgi:micrococcal nuclease